MHPNAPTPPSSHPSQQAPASTQASTQLQPPLALPRHAQSPTTADPGDPVAVLASKGITNANKTSIDALATVMESFGDFKNRSGAYTQGKEGALQLMAIAKLLREAALIYGDPNDRPVAKSTLREAVEEIKTAIRMNVPLANNERPTYANVTRNTSPGSTQFTRLSQSAEILDKQIFISMKNADKSSPALSFPSHELTTHCNNLLTDFFAKDINGGIPMANPLCGTSRSLNGNLTITFKSKENAIRERTHANKWVKAIDPRATTTQHTYAVHLGRQNRHTSSYRGDRNWQ
ncbi:hypothetical protein K439DRAFT_1625387 [Ramaria rubella]|nr:hypothetical protein K439DRAFT_1625387 [Ramaria rubella]